MTPMIQYPPNLPCVLFEGKTQQITDPASSTTFASGRNRRRRNFTAVPVLHSVMWRFSSQQQVAQFETWFRDTLKDGVEWFSMPMRLPQGDGPWAFQFVRIYEGPDRIGPDIWEVRAQLQQWLRPAGGGAP